MMAPIVGTSLQYQIIIKNINNILSNGLHKIHVIMFYCIREINIDVGEHLMLVTVRYG